MTVPKCSLLIYKQMLEQVFRSNIAPSGNHLFFEADYIQEVAFFCGRGRVKTSSTFAKTQLEKSKTTLVNRQIHYTEIDTGQYLIPSSSKILCNFIISGQLSQGLWWFLVERMAGNALSHLERDRFSERSLFSVSLASTGSSKGSHPERKVQFFDIVQKAFDPPFILNIW